MRLRIIIGMLFLVLHQFSFAQSTYGVRKVTAFFTEHIPGIIPVDINGNSEYHGPDTIYTIYVETKAVSINWTRAWKNGRSYSIIASAIKETLVEAGIDKVSNKKVLLRPGAGNKLYLLQLQPDEHSSNPPVKIRRGELILRGRAGRHVIIQRIPAQTELAAIPSV